MEIRGKVYCLFEQSGTFKNVFKGFGIDAEDYDIQNNFGETDVVADLFQQIDDAYERKGGVTVFDKIKADDLAIAFYPCIYFCATSQMSFSLECVNYRALTFMERIEKIIKRNSDRSEYYVRLIKLVAACVERGIRLIIENPWSEQTYLKANFIKAPDVVDMDRTRRGDYFKKPTAYWFWNCEPTYGESWQKDKETKRIMDTRGSSRAGICSEDRSMISVDYARNFVCDFILGKQQDFGQMNIFQFIEETV